MALEIEGSNPSTHPKSAYSSADQSIGLRNRGSRVRIPLGVPLLVVTSSLSDCLPAQHVSMRIIAENQPKTLFGIVGNYYYLHRLLKLIDKIT